MRDEASVRLAVTSRRRLPSALRILALSLAVGVVFAILLLYGAAQIWMLNDDALVKIDLAEDGPQKTRTVDLSWPGTDYIFHICCADSTALIDYIDGRPARSFAIRPTDPEVKGSHRAEIRLRPNALGQEVWYRGEVYVPADWQPSNFRVTAMQWHGTRDVHLLEPGRTPPLQLEIVDDRWQVVKSWDKRLRTPSSSQASDDLSVWGRRTIVEVPLAKEQWITWTFHVRWSTGSDGFIHVWRDGELVVEDEGPNAHHDLIGPYMKAGVYVPDWTLLGGEPSIPYRKLYFSQLALSGANDPFNLR